MLRLLKIFVYKTLQDFGLFVVYYPSIKALEEFIKLQPKDVIEFELKRIFYRIYLGDNHKLYNSALKQFIPNWNLEKSNLLFSGSGMGGGSLDVYRKVEIDNYYMHEKIYFTGHPDLKRILWLQENVSILLKDSKIQIPQIKNFYQGDILAAVYTEFLDLEKIPDNEIDSRVIQILRELYRLSSNKEMQLFNWNNLPEFIWNYKSHFLYDRNISAVKKLLKKENISLTKIENRMENSRSILTHGDIQITNLYQNNIVIDWDSSGIFPLGFDSAFIIFRRLRSGHLDINIQKYLHENFKNIIKLEDWDDFSYNTIYFLFVFMQECFSINQYENLRDQLILVLKNEIE